MSEISALDFSHKEVVTALLKSANIHEGIWMLAARLGLAAANVQIPGSNDINPSAIVSILNLRIEKTTEVNDLSADAAVVNPSEKQLPKKVTKSSK